MERFVALFGIPDRLRHSCKVALAEKVQPISKIYWPFSAVTTEFRIFCSTLKTWNAVELNEKALLLLVAMASTLIAMAST